jgi:ABC-2 type transport system ATP-binding protein
MAVIDVQNVSKSFGKTEAVKNVSFQVTSGKIFGLLGPNGAGKTTTIRMINYIISPDTGRISNQRENCRTRNSKVNRLSS